MKFHKKTLRIESHKTKTHQKNESYAFPPKKSRRKTEINTDKKREYLLQKSRKSFRKKQKKSSPQKNKKKPLKVKKKSLGEKEKNPPAKSRTTAIKKAKILQQKSKNKLGKNVEILQRKIGDFAEKKKGKIFRKRVANSTSPIFYNSKFLSKNPHF